MRNLVVELFLQGAGGYLWGSVAWRGRGRGTSTEAVRIWRTNDGYDRKLCVCFFHRRPETRHISLVFAFQFGLALSNRFGSRPLFFTKRGLRLGAKFTVLVILGQAPSLCVALLENVVTQAKVGRCRGVFPHKSHLNLETLDDYWLYSC
jgi:hypothetical protein